MKERIAFYGLGCDECGAFLATRENNNKKGLKLLRNGPGYLKWRSNLNILIVTAVYLTESAFSITAGSVK